MFVFHKELYNNVKKLDVVSIFLGMAEYYHVLKAHSGNLTITLSFILLCIFHTLLKLNPSEFLHF